MRISPAYTIALITLTLVGLRVQSLQLAVPTTTTTTTADEPGDLETTWEYEPRVWTPDESIVSSSDESEVWRDLPGQVQETPQEHDQLWRLNGGQGKHRINEAQISRALLRNQTNFYEPKKHGPILRVSKPHGNDHTNSGGRINRHYGQYGDNRLQQEPDKEKEKCDQFRVDIQETVICDRQRCEKLDFEWPKHDNQMILVQTTKHGMRFYQAQLEFEPPSWPRSNSMSRIRVDFEKKVNESANATLPKMPIKFDLLDLFKPKPTQTPSTTTTTTTTTTTSTTRQPYTFATSSTTEAPGRGQTTRQENKTELVTTFRLDTRRRMQKILGFGGALSDSTCRNIKSLSPTMSKSLMEDYFGPRGLQYSLVRMTMGSSDFSVTPYTNNDKPYEKKADERRQAYDESDDVEMKYFHLTDEDFEYKLPVARQAIATSRRELKFLSSLWSPPVWMKNNSHIVHGYLKGDVYGPYYKALADLIVRWHEAYRRQGIEFWGTTGLNEPITGIRPFIFHNSLGITRDDFATWIKLYLGPMLRQRGFQNLKLMPIDDNKGYMEDWASRLLDDEEVAKYVSGISLHWYMNDDYENLNFLVSKHPDKFLLSTEACNGYYPFQVHVLPGDWDRGMAYMLDIMRLMHKNVVGWIDWNMVLTTSGGPSWPGNYIDAAILVNAQRDEYYKSPMFYAIGHYSRFVVPDSYRLDHRLANARYDYPLEASGFYTPNEYVVIVVLNANKHQVPFKVIVDRQLVRVVDLKPESFNTIVFKWKRPS